MVNLLNGRTGQVPVEGKLSDWCHVLVEVPQGSLLGSILFTLLTDVDSDRVQNLK